MGVRVASAFNTAGNPVLPPNNTETVCFTTSFLPLAEDGALVLIVATITLTVGTGTTSLIIRVRLGATITGADLTSGGMKYTVVAGNLFGTMLVCGDTLGASGMPQYSTTIIQTGATAAGVVAFGNIFAFVL